ncbi:hypothetical protein V6N00_13140 [Tersicoccus sp. MR15.9]|uniref:hypothetical protein n=1 Tax=Tersicoccus mangrovi TaxID=3121635 RepID=UPI002FE5D6D6
MTDPITAPKDPTMSTPIRHLRGAAASQGGQFKATEKTDAGVNLRATGRTLWQDSETDPTDHPFVGEGDVYEAQSVRLHTDQDGGVHGEAVLHDYENEIEHTLTCDLTTGDVAVLQDGQALEGFSRDNVLATMLEDFRAEPDDGDHEQNVRDIFTSIQHQVGA